ncbi:glycosyltransferase [Cellulomonas marina]|uniref:Glycosyltransferase involved in cell wall bisynthesis n=1 Tax=Cellulomonas marina TaxID=988821 RepID=A0A1I0X2L5_9CELL|nr:glycosyltransferase [Cellulomonas marina]GIG29367.1 glycosyl transferase [Cellulomonas marina]SFA94628.1 Glycosyltransferase involved in cell wall bisynthesis [Cellulomonas marina]
MVRVALAHDYLTQRGGAERVALALTSAFPGSPLYTSVYAPEQTFDGFQDVQVRTSFLQHFGHFRRDPRLALPLLPLAWSQTKIRGADVVIASSTGWAHAVDAGGAKTIVYCHNPARWLYQPADYHASKLQRAALSPFMHGLRRWDARAAKNATCYVANSTVVAARIKRTYGIHAEVVHPPVAVDTAARAEAIEGLEPGFWLTIARGRGYKNTQSIIDAVERLPGHELVVVGATSDTPRRSGSVRALGVVSDAQLRWLYKNARALVSVSYEDFGLTPIEANAFGTPVAVLRAGGFLDSTAEGSSGVFIEDESPIAIVQALTRFPEFDREQVAQNAQRFSVSKYNATMRDFAQAVASSKSLDCASKHRRLVR